LLFDEERQPLGLARELEIIDEVVKEIKKDIPYFELRLVITGLKIVGKSHVQKMIEHI